MCILPTLLGPLDRPSPPTDLRGRSVDPFLHTYLMGSTDRSLLQTYLVSIDRPVLPTFSGRGGGCTGLPPLQLRHTGPLT